MMNGRLQGISAFPETFFVDKNGNIVGETYSGSHTLEEWKEIVEKELSAIKRKIIDMKIMQNKMVSRAKVAPGLQMDRTLSGSGSDC